MHNVQVIRKCTAKIQHNPCSAKINFLFKSCTPQINFRILVGRCNLISQSRYLCVYTCTNTHTYIFSHLHIQDFTKAIEVWLADRNRPHLIRHLVTFACSVMDLSARSTLIYCLWCFNQFENSKEKLKIN